MWRLVLSNLSVREWFGVVLLPALTLLLKYVLDTRAHRQRQEAQHRTQQTTASSEWRSDFDAIRGEWKQIREAWSVRIDAAEKAEAECQRRCDELVQRSGEAEARLSHLEGALGEMNRLLGQKNEAITLLELELGMLRKQAGES